MTPLSNIFFYSTFFLGNVLACLLGIFFWLSHHEWLDLKVLNTERYQPAIILDDEGQELFKFAKDRKNPVPFTKIPSVIIDAFIAAEDHQFFSHHGISFKGIVRSLWINLKHGRFVQGASTITQQLAKCLYTDAQRTVKRKIKEQIIALSLEQKYSKEQIFEAYVNNVYFGCGIYGIAAACKQFWNKEVEQITLAEAALLAGIVKNPAAYCPLVHQDAAFKRRNIVLLCMKNCSKIDDVCYQKTCATPLLLNTPIEEPLGLYVREMVRQWLEHHIGREALYTQGFLVQTSLRRSFQKNAERTFNRFIKEFREQFKQPLNGALITIEGATGAIKAAVGGTNFYESPFNRIKARRQLGSVFKPLVYTAGLENNKGLQEVEVDEPLSITVHQKEWAPHNVHRKFEGPLTRAYALFKSNNIISIKTALATGIDKVLEIARRCHLQTPSIAYPSLALGCLDATPLEAVAMFNIFAHRGTYQQPYLIEWVKDSFGKKIYQHKQSAEQVISWRHASQIARVLQMDRLKARFPHLLASDSIGKSGTATQATSCWWAGANPEYTSIVFIGRDDNKPMGEVYGMHTTFPLWLEYQKILVPSHKHFSFDPSLHEVTIDAKTGLPCDKSNAHTMTVLI